MQLHQEQNRFDLWVNQYRYLNDLNDYLWFILIIILGFYLIDLLIQKLKINKILGHFINFYHVTFTFFVVRYAEKFAHDGNSIFAFAKGHPKAQFITDNILYYKGSELLGLLLIPFAQYLNLSIINISLIFSFISSTALLFFLDIIIKINPKNKVNLLVGLIIILLPTLNFFTTGITKECLSITIFTFVLWNILNNKLNQNKIIILSVIVFLMFLRPYMGAILLFFLTLSFLISNKSMKKKKLYNIAFFPIITVMVVLGIFILRDSLHFEQYSLETVNNFILNRQQLTMVGFHYNIIDTDYISRFFIYIFGPLTLKTNSLFEIFLVFENLLIFSLFLMIIYVLLNNKFILPKLSFNYYAILFFSIFMIILLSNITANFGIIARNKYNFLFTLWVYLFYINKNSKFIK